MPQMTFLAKTFLGLEEVLEQEITAIGGKQVRKHNRAVSFTGDLTLLYRANLWLRTASRVLLHIKSFEAKGTDELYEGATSVSWDEYMERETTFMVHATVYSEKFTHSLFVVQRVKDAIVDFWYRKTGNRPSVDTVNPKLIVSVHISHNEVSLWLDSSGESLHKRGYKVKQTQAPLNEALAAGLILLSGWKGDTDLYDPMCGSGTLTIEAALIAQNIPPGLFRKKFAFEQWINFDSDLFQTEYADQTKEKTFEHSIYGYDASFYAIQASNANIQNAGQTASIQTKQIRVEEWKNKIANKCWIITNPPYGQRLKEDQTVLDLYASLGSMLKRCFANANAWVLSANTQALKKIGLRPSKKMKVLNGDLECSFNQYEIFEGKRKDFLNKNKSERN